MQSCEECLLMYRLTLRNALFRAGVASNPGVTDDWILEEVLKKMGVQVEIINPPKDEKSSA